MIPLLLMAIFPFQVPRAAEVVAEMEMSSPGSDWSQPGREAALANVTVDGVAAQNVMLSGGAERHTYRAFLGMLREGAHQLRIERSSRYSAAGSGLQVHAVRFRQVTPEDPDSIPLAHAPVLYARSDTVGGFSDVPLLAYCERLDGNVLQYTVIFSNEDGGTSTRALMARWGRTTDIEYIYKVWLDARGAMRRATIQAKDHKEIEFRGRRDGTHPILIPSTRNNMVSPQGVSPIRYQLAPELVDLRGHSREQVMDRHPASYGVMARELVREGKLRPAGALDGQKISDPRNYLYLEARLANHNGAVAVLVRLRGDPVWRSSHLGRADYAISRDGWVRTTVELPPGARPGQIAEIGFACLVPPSKTEILYGACRVEQVSKAFLLDRGYLPGAGFWRLPAPVDLRTGELRTFPMPQIRPASP